MARDGNVLHVFNEYGHPLAGRSSRHRLSRGEEFLFLLPSYQLVSVWSSRSRAPVFNRSVSDFGPHQSPIRIKAVEEFSRENFFPARGNNSCPRKLSVPRRVQGYRIHRSPGSPFRASNPSVAHGVGVPSDQIISELSRFQGTEQRLIRHRGFEPTPIQAHCSIPAVKSFRSGKRLGDIEGHLFTM